jgi:hypothetical protein
MGEKHSIQKIVAGTPSSLDTQTFKEIEQFSKAVCQNLAAHYGDRYTQTTVIYGLTAFFAAVHNAVKRRSRKK